MPCFNGADFISDSINSVKAQTYTNWELIIVDDHSSDDSVSIIKSFILGDDRIKLIELASNSGAAIARNTAIDYALGRYIAFLDVDDLWFPQKLERQLAFMNDTGASFSYTAYERIDDSGTYLFPIGVPEILRYHDLLKTCYIGCLTAIYDSMVYGKRLMPVIRKRQDYGLWLDLLRDGQEAKGLNEILATYRVRSDSISANKINSAFYNWLIYREMELIQPIIAMYYFTHYAVRGWLRRYFPRLAIRLGVLHRVLMPS
jgi:teichuronic acid biosynthesis glycosyltransferase TuaG